MSARRPVMPALMERSMTLWRMEHGSGRKFRRYEETRLLDMAGVFSFAAMPGLVFLMVLPLSLVLPALSILSFLIACGLALFAHYSRTCRPAVRTLLWDIAYAFTFVWIAAGLLSNPRQLLDWADRLAMAS